MEAALGIDLTLVTMPVRPGGQAILSGENQTATHRSRTSSPSTRRGDVTILAVAGAERISWRRMFRPHRGGASARNGTVRALVAPAGVDSEAAAALEKTLVSVLNDDAFQKMARDAGFTITPMGSADATAFLQRLDSDMYPVLLDAGLVKVRQK